MNKPYCIYLAVLLISCILQLPFAKKLYAQSVEFEAVEADVPYSKVASLASSKADNIVKYGSNPEQRIYIYNGHKDVNQNMQGPVKAQLVFIHGGCWLAQFDVKHSHPLSTALAQAGFTVYSIEYRRTGNGGEWPSAFDDVMLALETIASLKHNNQANQYQNTFIMGHSAGGHLASLAAHYAAKNYSNLPQYPLFTNTHFVGLAPIMDIKAYSSGENSCQSATPLFMGGEYAPRQSAYEQANPLNVDFDSLSSAAVMIGQADNIVPPDMAKHPHARYNLLPNVGHFDWIHPGAATFKHLINYIQDNQR